MLFGWSLLVKNRKKTLSISRFYKMLPLDVKNLLGGCWCEIPLSEWGKGFIYDQMLSCLALHLTPELQLTMFCQLVIIMWSANTWFLHLNCWQVHNCISKNEHSKLYMLVVCICVCVRVLIFSAFKQSIFTINSF